MKKTVYGVQYKSTTKGDIETKRVDLGQATFDEDNSISLSKYDELKRKVFKEFRSYQGYYIKLETADGLVDTFGGYPASSSFYNRITFKSKDEPKVKTARLAAGFTQKEISELLEVPQRTWEGWEAGRKIPPYFEKLLIEKIESLKKEGQ